MRNFRIEVDRQAARFWGIESYLLEAIEGAERYLTKLELLRESTTQMKEAWQKRLNRVVEGPDADRARRIIKGKIRELDINLAKAEKKLVDRWDTIRNSLQRYLAEKKRAASYVAAQEEIVAHNESGGTGTGGGGTSLWGQLGMALFTWKASNAFDDLAKLSGRKR